MKVSFENIKIGDRVSRNQLAKMWGYAGYQALARGVVTPKDDNKIILFITEEKQPSSEQYKDHLDGNILHWEGPSDHYSEERMVNSNDEIHVFYRKRHHSDFVYEGMFKLVEHIIKSGMPSKFIFKKLG